MTLNERWSLDRQLVEAAMKERCLRPDHPQRNLYASMEYSLMAGGKRLRPFLTLEFARVCGGETELALPAAAAIEMIHTYSLIHDDLPIMDNDDLRRGKPTNHKVFGDAVACLAGDALLTDAFTLLAESDLPAQIRCDCIRILGENAGPAGMVGGQVLDMEAEQRECTAEDVRAIQSRKTGCLIRAACQMGVVCGGGSPEQLQAAGEYADALGLAFQIRDDMLDATGDPVLLGKATAKDEKKNTFVKLYGIAACKEMILQETNRGVEALAAFSEPRRLTELAYLLAGRDF